jgi:hypothetical protein
MSSIIPQINQIPWGSDDPNLILMGDEKAFAFDPVQLPRKALMTTRNGLGRMRNTKQKDRA